MVAKQIFAAVTALLIVAGGCASKPKLEPAKAATEPTTAVAAAEATTAAPAAQPVVNPPVVLETSMGPRDAAAAAADVYYRQFTFKNFSADYNQYVYQPATLASDSFYGGVNSTTAAGYKITTNCNWIADGHTEVTVETDLPDAERDVVVKAVRAALTPFPAPVATTQANADAGK